MSISFRDHVQGSDDSRPSVPRSLGGDYMTRQREGLPRALVVVVVGYFLAFSGWRLFSSGSLSTLTLSFDLSFIPPYLLACWLMLKAASRTRADRRTASAWVALTLMVASTAGGSTVFAIQGLTDGMRPFPSLGDAFFLCSYPMFMIGLLRFPTMPVSRAGRLRLAVDAATVLVGGASIIWFLVLGPTATASGVELLPRLIATGYLVGDLLLMFGLVYLLMRTLGSGARRPLVFLIASALIVVVADVAYAWLVPQGIGFAGPLASIAYMAAAVCYVLAPASQLFSPQEPTPNANDAIGVEDRRNRARWLPSLVPPVVLGLLILVQVGSPTYQRVGLTIGATLVTGLITLRHLLSQRDLLGAQGELSHRALHDDLTQLPNRALVLDRAEQMLARARRQGIPMAALYVDLDGFKHINDTFGHRAGDEMLKTVAARLSGVVRESDTVGRLGGDEFVVLLDSSTLDVAPELVAERLLEVLRQPITLSDSGSRPLFVTASIGIAVDQHASADELLRNADMALYRAKATGKDRVAAFESSMQTAAEDRMLLEMDLRVALDGNQLFLLYQPTFNLQTEEITGVEALVRWQHPTRGLVTPNAFIGLAEESGLIVPIGRWVLQEACRQTTAWQADGHAVAMSVNVSARQLDDNDIVDDVRQALSDVGLDPAALTLEVTETALMRDPEAAALRLTALKQLGVRIAIDDFGTGYSSMAYLRQFPVDALKIDRSFISGMASQKDSTALVHTLIQLGKTLNLETLGEGIEEPAQLRNLQREQCDSGQGFLFARPLTPDAVERLLDKHPTPIAEPAS